MVNFTGILNCGFTFKGLFCAVTGLYYCDMKKKINVVKK